MKRAFRAGFNVDVNTALSSIVAAFLTVGMPASVWVAPQSHSVVVDGRVSPLLSAAIGIAAFFAASATSLAYKRRRESLVQRQIENHLAPAVVRRILERPDAPKRCSEQREVTALFTDIEGFSLMTRRADPASLVGALDRYFEGMATIIVKHGGMVDKIVGDAVHAFFNAALDLEGHPQKAIECAIALNSWAENFRLRPEVEALGFGRTRIGIETGSAIVGDVGLHAKLDYTAYGDAVNVAARLEQANKKLGSSICIGPLAASRCHQSLLRPLGKLMIDGRDDAISVFEPWPCNASRGWQESYLAAIDLYGHDPIGAARRFDQLAADGIEDRVPAVIARRMRVGEWQ